MLVQSSPAFILNLVVIAAAALLLITMALIGAGHLGETSRSQA